MHSTTRIQIGAALGLAAAAFVHQRAWQAQRANPPAGKFTEVDRPGYGYSQRPRGRLWGPQTPAARLHRMLAQIGRSR